MAGKSKIEWTDATWNPIVGCSVVSPGCTNCYAMRQARRIEAMGGATHYAGTTKVVNGKPVWTGKLALAPEAVLTKPLRWRRPRRIFVNSMGDLFHEDTPDAWIDRVFAVMALAPQHQFQVLTKRSKRMRDYCNNPETPRRITEAAEEVAARVYKHHWLGALANAGIGFAKQLILWPLPNVWLGVSAEDQWRADEVVPDLLATPAAVRFVSAEPLLGPVDFTHIKHAMGLTRDALRGVWHAFPIDAGPPATINTNPPRHSLDWIIAGGESGPGARPTHPNWVRSIRDQCAAAGVAFFFKQWGEFAPLTEPAYPEHGVHSFVHVGKKRAGRRLDGVEHNVFPEPRA